MDSFNGSASSESNFSLVAFSRVRHVDRFIINDQHPVRLLWKERQHLLEGDDLSIRGFSTESSNESSIRIEKKVEVQMIDRYRTIKVLAAFLSRIKASSRHEHLLGDAKNIQVAATSPSANSPVKSGRTSVLEPQRTIGPDRGTLA